MYIKWSIDKPQVLQLLYDEYLRQRNDTAIDGISMVDFPNKRIHLPVEIELELHNAMTHGQRDGDMAAKAFILGAVSNALGPMNNDAWCEYMRLQQMGNIRHALTCEVCKKQFAREDLARSLNCCPNCHAPYPYGYI